MESNLWGDPNRWFSQIPEGISNGGNCQKVGDFLFINSMKCKGGGRGRTRKRKETGRDQG
jgi:hypothetical protein